MKILPKSKKAIPPPPQVTELISNLLNASNEQLVQILKDVDAWKWPRSDLNAWVKVLNKFDDLMDQVIREYNVDKLQLDPFSPEKRDLLAEILRFERLLLENSTNRKTFNSYDRLNSLLSTSDLDILILALNLLLRPSQQYSAQPAVSHALSISTNRLQSLAKRWPHLREHGIGLVELAGDKPGEELEGVPPEAREVSFNFYRTDSSDGAEIEKPVEEVLETPATPRKPTAPSGPSPPSSAINIRLDESTIAAQPIMNVLASAIQAHSIPDSEIFELLCRIRTASSLSPGRKKEREKLVVIRLLAIAIFGHTHTESQATSALFLYEPDLIGHIAELLQVDRGVPTIVQTAAIAALDALARYKNKVQEVLTAVNAGVNHGILMALVRNMVAEVSNPESKLPHAFVEALLSFITYIASHASGGNMVVGAGLIPLLIQIMENRSPFRLPVISKTMQLVDNVLYSFTNAFTLFCAARGVDVLVDRIEYEIDFDINEYSSEFHPCALTGIGELPIQRIAILKHILRSMHRMMQSSGTAEGLRGLIDMSLLKSIKKIIEYRGLFGPNIFPLAINIMSTFVHNEPTSLAIIQEAGLPETFYNAIEIGIEPSIEVIQAIPNAIGALCLNDVGQALLSKRPSIIPGIFSIFTSEKHLKVLIDKENAVIIGTAVDELIRHHPSLKTPVFEALKSVLGRIEDFGMSYSPTPNIKQWYQLVPMAPTTSVDDDVTMQDDSLPEKLSGISPQKASEKTTEKATSLVNDDEIEEDESLKNHDNIVVSYIDVVGRFLEGFFQHPPHCKDFVTTTDGLERFGRLTGLPCLPYDFANSVASDSMVQVLRTMTEVATVETLVHLSDIVEASLKETKFFWDPIMESSKLLPFVDLAAGDASLANSQFRSLVTLHIRITLLSDVFATAGQAQGRAAIGLLQTLMEHTPLQVLTDLGCLHRASIWENITLNLGLNSKGIDLQLSAASSPLEGSPNQTNIELPPVPPLPGLLPLSHPSGARNGATASNGTHLGTDLTLGSGGKDNTNKQDGPRDWNASSLKHITQGLPNALAPFFQGKLEISYLNPDPLQKKQIKESSKIVADIMLKHLNINDFDNKAAQYNYYSVIFALFALLLIDERTVTNTLHTVELFAFYQSRGFDAIFTICSSLADRIEVITAIKEDSRSETEKKELLHAYSAMKVALHLIYPVVSSKPLFESGQTLLIVTRDKPETDPSYFEPHNFLVKLRSAALPLIRKLWEASWLIQAPLSVSRFVVRTVLELVNGEGEEIKSDSSMPDIGPTPVTITRPTGPDESRIQILTDMGFPRSAAERALARTHNNVNSATELLLSNPFPLPPDPVQETPAPAPAPAPAPVATENQDHSEIDNDAQSVETPTEENTPSPPPIPEIDEASLSTPGKSSEEWYKLLEEAREPLRASISRQSLLLIDEHLSLLFDLHITFTKSSKHQEQAVRDLVDDVKAFSAFALDVQEQPLANRCRLLALVLCEKPSSLDQDLRNVLMDHLLALLLSSVDPEHPPRWLAAHLLVTEALFTLSDEPRSINLPKEGEPILPENRSVGPPRTDARTIVFDFCLRLLAVDDLPADELLSVLRLFVLLTRDRDMAGQFVKRDGLIHLFKRLRVSPVSGGSSYVATILRHVVEDASIIQNVMQQSIKRYLTQPRVRIVDVTSFVRSCSAIALRDVDIFIDTTKSLCQLEQPYSSSPHIKLQNDSASIQKLPSTGQEQSSEMQVDAPSSLPSNIPQKSVESVVSLLVSELMTTVKVIQDAPIPASTTPVVAAKLDSTVAQQSQQIPDPQTSQTLVAPATSTTSGLSEGGTVAASPQIDIQDKHQYASFLMQCLTELLFSYDSCKIAFLSYSTKRRSPQTVKEPTNKFRNATLHFLLSDLVTYGTINSSSDSKQQRNRGMLCSWAMNVIGALCMDTSSAPDIKDVSTDLVYVRKFVLETISRAIKDVSSTSDNTESRYGRLLALADLCHRLLTARVNSNSRKHQEDIPTHLAKIMLEKNFVAILTTALSEVDLNYPNVRNLVAAILRPLEYLTKIAIKMSRSSTKTKEDIVKEDSVSADSESEDEDMEDDNREETPDLYRNSALGMYAGEMDDGQYDEDEDMDEDEDDQDVEMDYGEETGSEDTSASESEGEEDDLGHGEDGEVWTEGEDEDEEGLVENHDVDEEDEEHDGEEDDNDEEDAEDEDEEGMMWEDMEDDGDGLGLALDNADEAGHGVPIQVNHEEDEPEMASDEDEFALDHHHFHNDGIFSFGEAFVNSAARDLGGLFVHRRHRSAESQAFGRSRTAPAPETTTHPLLLDMSTASRSNNHQLRGFRHAQRIISNGPPNFLQTIDEMLGEGSIQVLQQIISREAGGGETFRIEVPAGTILHHSRRFLGSSRSERVPRPQGGRHGREFDPLGTLQRWAEEMKILHGDFVGERVVKLANHVTLALLPAAVEAIKAAKVREEEESKKKSEEAAKAEAEKVANSQQPSEQAPEKVLTPEQTPTDEAANRDANVTPAILHIPSQDESETQQPTTDLAMSDANPTDADTVMIDAHDLARPVSPAAPEIAAAIAVPPQEVVAGSSSEATNNPPERVTVMIHGSAVDITDTGIDPTFLEALPDDMREEVLNQHVRDQQASRVERPPDSQISSEFLDALPPEIRAEIIQQEAMERARRRTVEESARAPVREAAEIDPASFIASLDPTLRQAVLLDQDDGFIQSLPSHMIAEAGAYRDELHGGRSLASRIPARNVPGTTPIRKYTPQHDAILLLDRPSVAVLVRLLFFPQVLKKTLLFKVLVNICENAKTRIDLFNILLGILQDGTADLAAVDKSFAQMSVRNRDTKPQTPKAAGKQKATADHVAALALPPSQMETVPDLIAQRCLEALTYIVTTNELSSLFFLTEHDIPAGLRRTNLKKGKGKEKQNPQTHYPLVLLLNLLDRQNLLRTPAILESVVGLLATVTRPLTSLKDQTKSQESSLPSSSLQSISTAPAPESSTGTNTSAPAPSNQAADAPVVSTDSAPSAPDASGSTKPSDSVDDKALLPHPPQIPNSTLRLIVNILTIGECSGRTFQQSLALIQHLSYIPDSRDVIANELKAKAQEFGQTLYADLDELAVALQESQSNVMVSSVATKFSPASSTQAKLLRVLKTIDYMYTPKPPSSGSQSTTSVDDVEKVQAIYESFRFTPLWRRLGDCLSLISENAETAQVATVLLPLIEALMVVCKFVASKGSGNVLRAIRASTSPRSPATPKESMEDLFISFTDAHRKILNLMVRNNPSLMSGSFSLLVNNSRVLDFDNKRNYFNQQLHRKPHIREHYGTLQLNVRRARVFEDSFLYLQRKTGEQIKHGKLSVRFYDEEGVDAGGLTREWFQILARQMFNPNNALFQPCAADKLTYQPNKNSWVNPEHLSFFKFVGRVIGKAIYDGRLLDAYFARSLYRQLLGKPVDYKDVEWVDPEYYNSLCWILENDPTALDLTFSVEADEFGVNRIVPLKDGGEGIPVTQENKREFVQLSAQYRLYSSIKDQIESLSSGFYEIIPKDLITIFNEQELELLISGTPDIDVDEWRAATEYNGYTSSDPNIVWWWRALKSFNREERAKVLSFATGTSRVPLSGFLDLQGVQGVQKFSIHRAYGEPDRLPQAHTCFNQIDLPQYTSYEMLRQQLLMAIHEGGEGFAFS
ncbi:E3 ubiquitin-protein ligase ptr1 [Psilocybe cubensis]|uniref:E3 ubiquitin-protein ligase ptr1 n=2 Tax=Psilocybe cubensis TaxID=181762 RepID=A0ACB8HCG6_PSICU|nr:E3 ubiquitin-protein ligase ptr1 [Psilocybe cubensis]KAH9485384.1 E3 ubiquitin-protein ligase ptr1 [Psilocybe cubensis]